MRTSIKISKWIPKILFFAFFVFPIAYLLLRSVSGIWSYPAIFPETMSIRGWNYLVSNHSAITKSILSSLWFSLSTVVLSLLLALAPAKVLARRQFSGKVILESFLLIPLLLPAFILALGLYPVFLRLGLTDNWLGVSIILTFATFPYMLRALLAGFESYSSGYEITASMLGAGHLRRMYTVHIPHLLPAIISGGMVVFLSAFTEYFMVFLIGGGLVSSFTSYLLPLIRSGDWGIGSILSIVFLLLPILLYSLLDRMLKVFYTHRGLKVGGHQ